MTFAPEMNTPDLMDIIGGSINDLTDGFIARQERKKGETGKSALAHQMFPDASPKEIKALIGLPDELFKVGLSSQAGIRAAVEKEKVKGKSKLELAESLGLSFGGENKPVADRSSVADSLGIDDGSAVTDGAPQQPTAVPQPAKSIISPKESKFSDDQIVGLALIDPQAARIAQSQSDQNKKNETRVRDRQGAPALDFIKKINANADELVEKQALLRQTEDALESKNLGFFSIDNIAEHLKIEGLKSPAGVVFNNAIKEFYVKDIQRIGSRPNEYIERQLRKAFQMIGRSNEANMAITESQKFMTSIEEKRIEITNRKADAIDNAGGEFTRSFITDVNKELKEWVDKEQSVLEDRIRELSKGGFKGGASSKELSRDEKRAKLGLG